jgi:hypothetical protein
MPRTRRAKDKQIDGFRRVSRNMRGGNGIIGGASVNGKDGKPISAGNTATCSGLLGNKTFQVNRVDATKKLVYPTASTSGSYAAAKCTKADPNATVKDKTGHALKVGDNVNCAGTFGSSSFKIAKVEGATGKVFDAKNSGYVAATKCTYEAATGMTATKKTDGKKSAIKVQIKEADIKTYISEIQNATGSTLLGYTKKDGSNPVQFGGNMKPDGTLEEEGGALKTATTLSTYILIFRDTINPKEFETQVANNPTLKSKMNVDIATTPIPSQYNELRSGLKGSSGKLTAIKIQIKTANLTKFKAEIQKAAGGSKIVGYTDKSGNNPIQLGGSLNPDGTLDEEGGALATLTTLSTYIVIFDGPVDPTVFAKNVAASTTLKPLMNVDKALQTSVPASYTGLTAGHGASGTETAVKIQIKPANLTAHKADIEKAAGHKILGYTDKSGVNPQQLGGFLNSDGTFDEEGGALATLTTLSTYIVIFDGVVNATAFASKVASTPALKAIMNVDTKTTPVPASFNDLRAGHGASGTQTAIKIQIKSENLRDKNTRTLIEKAAGHKILGFTNSKGAKAEQLGGSLNPDGTFDEEGGALKTLTTLSTFIVIFDGSVNATAFASKVAANPALNKIMNVDIKLTDVPASFTELLSAPPPSNTPSNMGSSAPPEEEAAAEDAAAAAPDAAAAAEAVASTTSDPTLKAAAEAAAAKPGATPASVQKAVHAAAAAAPAATASRLPEDTAVCRLPSGKAGVQPSWEPDQDYPNPVSVLPAQVPSSMQVSVTGISEKHIQPAKTKIGTKTLYYIFVLIKGKVFGITAAASSIGNAMELMQAKMGKETGVVKVLKVTGDIKKLVASEAKDSVEEMIDDLQTAIDTLQASPAADSATAAAIQQQVATHKKTIAALKISLEEYKKSAQSGGRRKSRRHYRKKARLSRKRRHMRR